MTRSRVAVAVAIVLAALGALALRIVIEGRSALAAGDTAAAEGRTGGGMACRQEPSASRSE